MRLYHFPTYHFCHIKPPALIRFISFRRHISSHQESGGRIGTTAHITEGHPYVERYVSIFHFQLLSCHTLCSMWVDMECIMHVNLLLYSGGVTAPMYNGSFQVICISLTNMLKRAWQKGRIHFWAYRWSMTALKVVHKVFSDLQHEEQTYSMLCVHCNLFRFW